MKSLPVNLSRRAKRERERTREINNVKYRTPTRHLHQIGLGRDEGTDFSLQGIISFTHCVGIIFIFSSSRRIATRNKPRAVSTCLGSRGWFLCTVYGFGGVFSTRLALVFPRKSCLQGSLLERFFPFWQIAKTLALKRRLGQPRTRWKYFEHRDAIATGCVPNLAITPETTCGNLFCVEGLLKYPTDKPVFDL